MRPAIPASTSVDSAFKLLLKRLDRVRQSINRSAARDMKCDDYQAVKAWMEVGQTVGEFGGRVENFLTEWRRLVKTSHMKPSCEGMAGKSGGGKSSKTPTWKFCEPAIKFVAERGGSATHAEVLAALETRLALTDADRRPLKRGPAWHVSVKRAARQCRQEGWIERRVDLVWKLTSKGRAVAAQGAKWQGPQP
jgi:Mrr N-terminal domain